MSLRTLTRAALYRASPALVQRLKSLRGEVEHTHAQADWWNRELAGRMSTPNRNGQISNALRDQTTAVLISLCGPQPTRVADFGCGFGDILPHLIDRGCQEYVGVDLSDWVIERGRAEIAPQFKDRCNLRFECADLRTYEPVAGAEYDVIIFNEVLKYLEVDEAIAHVDRLAHTLTPGGVICASLSGDVKSQSIFTALESHFEWIYGTVYQQRPDRAVYRLTKNNATPPYLVGMFRPRRGAA